MILPSIIGLLATFVYQYDFTGPSSPGTDYIQFKEAGGTGGLGSVYALSVTSVPSPTINTSGNEVPLVPATTFTLGDLDHFTGFFSWGDARVSGSWEFDFYRFPELWLQATENGIQTFWPQPYDHNEASSSGVWKFAGAKNVPEAGSTLLYMTLGMIALIWKKK